MFRLNLFDGGAEASAESSTATEVNASQETSSENTGSQPEEKLYTKSDMSKAIQERIKGLKARESDWTEREMRYKGITERLSSRYGTDDLEELATKLDNDKDWLISEARKNGMDPDAYESLLKTREENRRFKAREEEARKESERRANVDKWRGEERELQKTYPNFSLSEEFENPRFANLLMNGISVKDAYTALHVDDIVRGGVQYAYEKGRTDQADLIRANGQRPLENGVSAQTAVNTKIDINNLSDDELDALEQRVMKGERITLR